MNYRLSGLTLRDYDADFVASAIAWLLGRDAQAGRGAQAGRTHGTGPDRGGGQLGVPSVRARAAVAGAGGRGDRLAAAAQMTMRTVYVLGAVALLLGGF